MNTSINNAVTYAEQIDRSGFAIVPNVATADQIAELLHAIENVSNTASAHARESVYAMRNLIESVPSVAELARSRTFRDLVEPILGPNCFAVRGILFDKTPDANWKVIWHQDLSIAVQERIDTAGFGPWSVKDGVPHVQPPVEVLENMLTVRLHLDDCGEDNGAVRVLPGSHCNGRLNAELIIEYRTNTPEVACTSPAGGALIMRPLLLHASSAATSPRHRRVIHIEYAASQLPNGLDWFTTVR